MISSVRALERNALAMEAGGGPELLKKEEATTRSRKHVEMASEWLRRKRSESQFCPSSGLGEGGVFKDREPNEGNWQHLEWACEWLRRREKTVPPVHKQRISWEPVSEATSYVLYVSRDRKAFEPTKFLRENTPGIISKRVGGKTELIIPDEWPEFPMELGFYHIRIIAQDRAGNEKGPFLSMGLFRFLRPPAPVKGGIEILSLK